MSGPIYRQIQVGRLFLRSFATRGRGFEFRRLHRDNPGVQLWLGRRIYIVAWVHRRSCQCYWCDFERIVQSGDL